MKIYRDMKEFERYISKLDPLDRLVENKREINWKEKVKNCESCGETFTFTHPLTKFCEKCR